MSRSIRFIHAADLHLGAPLRGLKNLSPRWADRIFKAILEAYDKLISVACSEQVDFVIFAGDVFDTTRPSFLEFTHFVKGLKALQDQGILVYLCTGNHDPYTSWSTDFEHLPTNVNIFSPHNASYFTYEKEGEVLAVLGGRSYYSQTFPHDESIIKGLRRAELYEHANVEAPFALGVVHTGLHFDAVKAPAKLSELHACGLDYWALGHIHKRWQDSEEDPHVAYSGVIQGRDIKEAGPRGVNLVTLQEYAPNKIEFVPCSAVVWQMFDYDIGKHSTLAELQAGIMRALFALNGNAYCEEMCTRITLTGESSLARHLRDPHIVEDLRCSLNDEYSSFYCDAIINKTHLPSLELLSNMEKGVGGEGGFLSLLSKHSERRLACTNDIFDKLQEDFVRLRLRTGNVNTTRLAQFEKESLSVVQDLLIQRRPS